MKRNRLSVPERDFNGVLRSGQPRPAKDYHESQMIPDYKQAIVSKSKENKFKIDTWNVRTLSEVGKMDNVEKN